MPDGARPGTDQQRLRELAYATSGLLADRAALYAARVPPVDLPAWVLSHLPESLPGPVLDVGCGPGWYLRKCGEVGLDAIGVDLSVGMAREAAAIGPTCVADAQALPMRSATVGAVLLLHMLYHVPDPGRALAEARRVVRPGGVVAIVTNNPGHLGEMRSMFREELQAAGVEPGESTEAHFDGVSARDYLDRAFTNTRAVTLEALIRLKRPGPAISHLATARSLYPSVPEAAWAAALMRVRQRIESEIGRAGVWETRTSNVLFIHVV